MSDSGELIEKVKRYTENGYKWIGHSAESGSLYSLFANDRGYVLTNLGGEEFRLDKKSSQKLLHWYVGKSIEMTEDELTFSKKIPHGLLESLTRSVAFDFVNESYGKVDGRALFALDLIFSPATYSTGENEELVEKMLGGALRKLGINDTPHFGTITHHFVKVISDAIEDREKFRKDVLDKDTK